MSKKMTPRCKGRALNYRMAAGEDQYRIAAELHADNFPYVRSK